MAIQYLAAFGCLQATSSTTLATVLPLRYAASFMMVVVPSLFLGAPLAVTNFESRENIAELTSFGDVLCLVVPSLLSGIAKSLANPIPLPKVTFLTTAGYLSSARMNHVRRAFPGARMATSYGASETGMVTIDPEPSGLAHHVGTPISGKPVWISDPDSNGVGRIATAGPDCRFAYLTGEQFVDESGAVSQTDTGHFDDSGKLFLDGRLDGSEKLHGETVYPRAIERELLRLDGVEDASVRIEATDANERLCVTVVGTRDEADVRSFCQKELGLRWPVRVNCVLPDKTVYTAHGKIK